MCVCVFDVASVFVGGFVVLMFVCCLCDDCVCLFCLLCGWYFALMCCGVCGFGRVRCVVLLPLFLCVSCVVNSCECVCFVFKNT